MKKAIYLGGIMLLAGWGLYAIQQRREISAPTVRQSSVGDLAEATFASGCFWCTEAVFERLDGVVDVISGYAGGHVKNPSYREVTSGQSGHAEACRIRYDPERISYADLLEVFWQSHNPTTLNRQGPDVGSQYRSVIFHHDDEQREIAEESKRALDDSGQYNRPIVTSIEPLTVLYTAEDYHQDYFRRNPNAAYCLFVIRPKLNKLDL